MGAMTQHTGPLAPAYVTHSDGEKVGLIRQAHELEERILRACDQMAKLAGKVDCHFIDSRWLAAGRARIEEGFMFLDRAIMQPGRTSMPEDIDASQE